jgi:hypothetical protein
MKLLLINYNNIIDDLVMNIEHIKCDKICQQNMMTSEAQLLHKSQVCRDLEHDNSWWSIKTHKTYNNRFKNLIIYHLASFYANACICLNCPTLIKYALILEIVMNSL